MKYSDIENYALNGEDLQKLVGTIRFVKYPDLDQETLESLFRKRKQVVVLFLTENDRTGHWICMLEHPNKVIEVFDSYGLHPDGHRMKISEEKRIKLDQTAPQFMDLFRANPEYKLIYNTKQLQKDGTATCGRHIAVRIMHCTMNLDEYVGMCEEGAKTPDEFVCLVTYRKLGK